MAEKNSEGYGVTGFPQRAGDALIKASTKFKSPRVPTASKLPSTKAPKLPKVRTPSKLY